MDLDSSTDVEHHWDNQYTKKRMDLHSKALVVMCNPTVDYFYRVRVNWMRWPLKDISFNTFPTIYKPIKEWLGSDGGIYKQEYCFAGMLYSKNKDLINRNHDLNCIYLPVEERYPKNIFIEPIEVMRIAWDKLTKTVNDFWVNISSKFDGVTQMTKEDFDYDALCDVIAVEEMGGAEIHHVN